jgi:hypothetical protein
MPAPDRSWRPAAERVTVLGLTFKKDVPDIRESGRDHSRIVGIRHRRAGVRFDCGPFPHPPRERHRAGARWERSIDVETRLDRSKVPVNVELWCL